MFDVQTCPTCEDFLPPGASLCADCARPDPDRADPWRSGTPEAIAAPGGTARVPVPGSPLATGPPRGPARRSSRLTRVAALLIVGCLVVVADALGVLPPILSPTEWVDRVLVGT